MRDNKSLRARVLALGIGESITISLGDYGYTTIRSYAYELGVGAERKFTTHRDRDARTYTISRVA